MLVNQPNSAPTAKMTAVGIAGLVVTALVTVAAAFGITIPETVSSAALALVAAVTTIATFVAGYWKREQK